MAALLAAPASGCRKAEHEPVKVERDAADRRADRTTPFKNPKRDPPGPRQPAQLSGEELEANIAEARRLVESGDSIRAMHLLYKCANREPPSVRCDAELAMILLENRTRKAHAEYFAEEAVRLDEPAADSDLYRRLADVAARRGRFTVAIDALQRVIDRGDATPDDFVALSHALQSDSKRLDEAISALTKAHELEPERNDWLFERAVLIGQTPDTQKARELFEQYRETLPEDSKERAEIDERIFTLDPSAPSKSD